EALHARGVDRFVPGLVPADVVDEEALLRATHHLGRPPRATALDEELPLFRLFRCNGRGGIGLRGATGHERERDEREERDHRGELPGPCHLVLLRTGSPKDFRASAAAATPEQRPWHGVACDPGPTALGSPSLSANWGRSASTEISTICCVPWSSWDHVKTSRETQLRTITQLLS